MDPRLWSAEARDFPGLPSVNGASAEHSPGSLASSGQWRVNSYGLTAWHLLAPSHQKPETERLFKNPGRVTPTYLGLETSAVPVKLATNDINSPA